MTMLWYLVLSVFVAFSVDGREAESALQPGQSEMAMSTAASITHASQTASPVNFVLPSIGSNQGLWGETKGTLWSKPIVNCSGTLAAGWCILPHFKAIELCATIPGCYWAVTTNAGWNSAYPNSAQLGYAPLINNAEWTSFGQPGPWSHIPGHLWSNQIVCNGTLAPGWCILPVAQAIELCATLPGCHWAITTNAGWNSAYPKSAQLGYAPLIANAEWTTYAPQGFWTTTSGTLWSQPITNCPGTLAAGWCILPQYKAIEYCATIPGCVWSVTTNAGWNSAYSNSAQLGYAPLIKVLSGHPIPNLDLGHMSLDTYGQNKLFVRALWLLAGVFFLLHKLSVFVLLFLDVIGRLQQMLDGIVLIPELLNLVMHH